MIDGVATVRVTRRFDASPERVFDAWLDPDKARRFLFATPAGQMIRAEIDARVGGTFSFVDRRDGEDVEHVGTYLEIDRPHRLVFTFAVPKYSDAITKVTIHIATIDGGCELTLTHEGVLPEYLDGTESGWTSIFAGLASVLAAETAGETCGAGLAANAKLPLAIGELMAAISQLLDVHQQALDLTDDNARRESHAYVALVQDFRSAAARLTAIARQMESYRDLPMARHDQAKMSRQRPAFESVVEAEERLLTVLAASAAAHRGMLQGAPSR